MQNLLLHDLIIKNIVSILPGETGLVLLSKFNY